MNRNEDGSANHVSHVQSGRRDRIVRYLIAVVALVTPLFAFQNCSVPAETEKEEVSSLAEKAGFAYDAYFDQLAYMSCSELTSKGFDQSAYFTFRAGAYRTGGLMLRSDYFTSLDASLQRRLHNTEAKMNYLMESKTNTKTQLQFAIRGLANFQSLYTQSGTAEEDEDFANIFDELGSAEMFEPLLALPSGQRIRHMRNGLPEGRSFEADIYMGDSTALQDSMRAKMSADGMLALTYMDEEGGGRTYARGPAMVVEGAPDEKTSVFGKGYIVRFRQPTAISGTLTGSFPNHVLREVTEINLEDRNDTRDVKPWVCPTTLQFRIVRPEDLDLPGTTCIATADPAVPDANLRLVRRSLRVEDWYVDMTNRCVVTKKYQGKGCYGNIKTVQYDLTQPCTPNNDNEQCLHYVSICYRQE